MPQVFKTLVTISAWALFILSWLIVLLYIVRGIQDSSDWVRMATIMGTFIGCITLSAIVMKLRQTME
jgi:hypothetical protein